MPPGFVLNQMEDYYQAWFADVAADVTIAFADIWEDGHSGNAGEACFTENGRLRCVFQATTGCQIPEGW